MESSSVSGHSARGAETTRGEARTPHLLGRPDFAAPHEIGIRLAPSTMRGGTASQIRRRPDGPHDKQSDCPHILGRAVSTLSTVLREFKNSRNIFLGLAGSLFDNTLNAIGRIALHPGASITYARGVQSERSQNWRSGTAGEVAGELAA